MPRRRCSVPSTPTPARRSPAPSCSIRRAIPSPAPGGCPASAAASPGALFLHRLVVTEGDRAATSEVGWVQSAAMLVRRAAAEAVGYLDPDFFVYSDETDFAKRLRDAGWRVLHVPAAQAVHHEQLATDRSPGAPPGGRVPPRPRPLHAQAPLAGRSPRSPVCSPPGPTCRGCSRRSCSPATTRAVTALHARCALRPQRGEGLREGAEAYNAASRRGAGGSRLTTFGSTRLGSPRPAASGPAARRAPSARGPRRGSPARRSPGRAVALRRVPARSGASRASAAVA